MGKRKGPLAATKKKGAGDFKKRTAKVGKRAVKPANVNVKSKQLYMPTQRLASASAPTTGTSSTMAPAVPPGQERTAKGQTLSELLHATRHHNEGARVAAVQGLKELVAAFPGVGQREMAALLDGGLELLLDPEEDVRRAGLGLLRALLLPSASASASLAPASASTPTTTNRATLLPFAPLAATYLCAALSHLDQSIRRDGLAYLDVLVQSLGPHLLPHAQDILPSLAALLDRPPQPSKRQAARLLLQQKQQQRSGQGEEGGGASAKEKDQQLKARMELWAARAAVLRCTLGLTRLLPHSQQQQAAAISPSTPRGVLEWRRSPRVLLLRRAQAAGVEGEGAAEAVGGEEEEGRQQQSMEALAALLPRVKNYVLELSTTPSATTTPMQEVDGGDGDGKDGGEHQQAHAEAQTQAQHQPQQQQQHQVEAGPALDALAGAIEFALVASQCLAAPAEEGEEGAAATTAAVVGEMRALLDALLALFPLQLADGATALRTSALGDEEGGGEEEEEEEGGIVTEDGLNLALAEVATLGATAISSSSSSNSGQSRRQKAAAAAAAEVLDAGVVEWLVGFMERRARALGGQGTAGGERLGARLLRLLRGLLPRLYAGGRPGEQALAERMLERLEACADAWPAGAANKRAALRLLCDLLPRRPRPAARAWVERTARTQLPQWMATAAAGKDRSGAQQLVPPVLAVLLRDAALSPSSIDGEGGGPASWLPAVVTALLDPPALAALPPEARLRVCELLYYCGALPAALQEAVVALVHAEEFPGGGGGNLLLDYLVEVLHHRRQLLTPSGYLTLLGRLLTLPAPTPLPHAAAVGAAVGRAFRQLQQRPGSILPAIAPLLQTLLAPAGGEGAVACAATRLVALVVVRVVGEWGGEGEEASSVSIPPQLAGCLVSAALGQGKDEDDDGNGGDERAAAFAAAGTPLLLALLKRHRMELLPPLVEQVEPLIQQAGVAPALLRFQQWLREPGLNWAPAREALGALRRQCVEGGQPRFQGIVHDLDLLPLGLGLEKQSK